MRNLKKVLALALALAMTLTFFANAAFTDDKSIDADCKVAVDTLVALGVLAGDPDGSFRPEDGLTRAEAAKIIYTIRNKGNADASGFVGQPTKFADIANHWAKGYIVYCESLGIVSGKSDTLFYPDDQVTGSELAKMLLTMLGYKSGMQGYTGTWKGVPVTVMASGMGIPSIGIYSWELYNFYDVDNIIRVGSAGALADDLKLMDVVAGAGACTDSNFAHQFGINGTFAPIADYTLLSQAVAAAAANGVALHVGNVLSSDNFYDDGSDGPDQWKKMGVLAIEMEAAGLYMNAARAGKRALGLFTISDHIYRAEELTSEQRQNSFVQMITIALDTAVNMANL